MDGPALFTILPIPQDSWSWLNIGSRYGADAGSGLPEGIVAEDFILRLLRMWDMA